jgi:hypothetical protein
MAWGLLVTLSLILMASSQDLDEIDEEEPATTEPTSTTPQTTPPQSTPTSQAAALPLASPVFLALTAAAMLFACT